MNDTPPTARPLCTVFLLQDLKFGGTQTQTIALAARLNRERFQSEIWTLIPGGDLDPGPTPLIELGRTPQVGPASLFRLWRQLRRSRPGLLVLMTVVPNIWGRLLGRLAGVPLIVGTCRGEGAARRQHECRLWRRADHVACNAAFLKRELERDDYIPGERISFIANGVDTQLLQPSPLPEKPVIFCAGRLAPMKDQLALIKAFEQVVQQRPDAELWIAGEGPLHARLSAAGSRLPAGSFRLLSPQSDIGALLRQCAVFALSSCKGEGMPNVVLEAMACGRPVVATAIDGLDEVVEDGRTGLLVPSRNSRLLADAILKLLDDRNLAARMGDAGRKRVMQCFSMETMIAAYEELFAQLARH